MTWWFFFSPFVGHCDPTLLRSPPHASFFFGHQPSTLRVSKKKMEVILDLFYVPQESHTHIYIYPFAFQYKWLFLRHGRKNAGSLICTTKYSCIFSAPMFGELSVSGECRHYDWSESFGFLYGTR